MWILEPWKINLSSGKVLEICFWKTVRTLILFLTFSWGIFIHVVRLDQIVSENIRWIVEISRACEHWRWSSLQIAVMSSDKAAGEEGSGGRWADGAVLTGWFTLCSKIYRKLSGLTELLHIYYGKFCITHTSCALTFSLCPAINIIYNVSSGLKM